MKRLIFIAFLFPFLVSAQYEVKPDVKPMFRAVYEPLATISVDSAQSFVMTGVQYDSVNQTVIGFDVNGTRFVTAYGASWPTDTTNKLFAFNLADTASYKDTTTYFKVVRDSVKYFRLFTYNAASSAFNQDTAFIEGSPLDSLASFIVDAHDLDTAIVTTAIGFDPDADNYRLEWWEGLSAGAIGTGTLALNSPDSALFKGLKVKIAVPGDNTNYAFRLFSTGIDTIWNNDTTQLDRLSVAASFFEGGIIWVEGTDTTQYDSIYTSGSALNFESDGFLFSLDSIGTSGVPASIDSAIIWFTEASVNATTDANDSITVWNDISGNDNDLLAADQSGLSPNLDGDTVKFAGVTQSLVTGSFTWDEPLHMILVMRQNTWTNSEQFIDNVDIGSLGIRQSGSSPNIIGVGSGGSTGAVSFTLGDFEVVQLLVEAVVNDTIIVGTTIGTGANIYGFSMGGFYLGSDDGLTGFSDIDVIEIIGWEGKLDETARNEVKTYLDNKYGL